MNQFRKSDDPDNAIPPDADTRLVACIALLGLIGSLLLGALAIYQGRILVGAASLIIAITIAGNFFMSTRGHVSIRQLNISLAIIGIAMLATMLLSGTPTPPPLILFSLIPFIMGALGSWRGMLFWLIVNALVLAIVYVHAPFISTHYIEPASSYSFHYYMTLLVFTLFITATAYVLMGKRNAFAIQMADVNNQLVNAQKIARSANEAKGQFLGRLSHELRTPLNAVLGFSEVMARDRAAALSTDQLKKLKHIQASGQVLLEIVDEILEITKHDQRSGFMAVLPIPLSPLISEAVAFAADAISERNLTLEIDAASLEALHVLADRKMLSHVVAELLSNAIQFNRIGGRIDIDAQVVDGYVRINFTDTGHGIPSTALGELFEPFNRYDGGDFFHRGTGLGLTTARSVAQRMNGRIDVQSIQGTGSTFTIVMPAYLEVMHGRSFAPDPPPTSNVPSAHTIAADWGLPDVLYVEDNQLNQLVMRSLFEELGMAKLHLAGDGAEGLASAKAIKPAVLLLDIHLPDFDGIELLERIRAIPGLALTPAIAVSADAMPLRIEAAMGAGFVDYLVKPVSLETLRHALEQQLTNRQRNALS